MIFRKSGRGRVFAPQYRVPPDHQTHDANARTLTWAMLLGRWTEFARSAVALPKTGEAGRYRDAVPPLITLHAVTHALGEIDLLDADEAALAVDRAEILIAQSTDRLATIWDPDPLPEAVGVLIEDAAAALDHAAPAGGPASVCIEWIVTTDHALFAHPADLLEAIVAARLPIDLYVPSPGIPFFAGSVAASLRVDKASDLAPDLIDAITAFLGDAEPRPAAEPRQTYRQFDFARGGPVRDAIAPLSATNTPGQPLLVPGLRSGEIRPVPLPPRAPIRIEQLPVVEIDQPRQ